MKPIKVILLVLGIMAVLGGCLIAVLAYFGGQVADDLVSNAREERARADLKVLGIALMGYERINRFVLPTQEQGLEALVVKPTDEPISERWRAMLANEEALVDPWGQAYQYRIPAEKSGAKFDLWSFGPDGIASEDDIGNW